MVAFSFRSLSFSITATISAGDRLYLRAAVRTASAVWRQVPSDQAGVRQRTSSCRAHRVAARQLGVGWAGPVAAGVAATGGDAGGGRAMAAAPGRAGSPTAIASVAREANRGRLATATGAGLTRSPGIAPSAPPGCVSSLVDMPHISSYRVVVLTYVHQPDRPPARPVNQSRCAGAARKPLNCRRFRGTSRSIGPHRHEFDCRQADAAARARHR